MPPPSNHRKPPSASQPLSLGAVGPSQRTGHSGHPGHPGHTGRPQRAEKSHPPVAFFFLEDTAPTATRLSAASITPIAPSARQSVVSDLDDGRPSPLATDRPPLPTLQTFQTLQNGHPPKPTEAERYKQRYLNRRTLPAPAPSTTFAAAAATVYKARARTQSLGSASSASTSTGEQQRSTTTHNNKHKRSRSPSNPTLPAIVERPLPALPRRKLITHDPRNPPSNTHVRFNTHATATATPSEPPPRLARVSDDSRSLPSQPSTTSPHTINASPTSTLVHSASPHQERHPSPTKTPSKKSIFPLNKNIHKFFRRGRSVSVGCVDTATPTSEQHEQREQQKRPMTPTPTPDKFHSLPSISTSDISRPIVRRSTSAVPANRPRPRHRHHGEMSAVKRIRRVTPLTEVDLDAKKDWRSSFIDERKVPVYHPPVHSPYDR